MTGQDERRKGSKERRKGGGQNRRKRGWGGKRGIKDRRK